MRKRGKKSVTSTETNKSEYLPEEVISEILCRLPVKSILQCSCVCKLWYSLIRKPNFITAHLQKTTLSSSNPNTNHYFLCNLNGRYSLRFDNEDFEEYMQLPAPVSSSYPYRFAGSCNGVICLSFNSSRRRVVLYNPSVRKLISLPNFGIEVAFYPDFIGFGYSSIFHDYKVLRILIPNSDSKAIRAELYSLTSNSWKDITSITPNHIVSQFAYRAFVNGSLYWIATQKNNNQFRNLIMVFDVNDEIFHEIPLPECIANVDSSYLSVYQLGESEIAVAYQEDYNSYKSDIWVMKNYGVVESWVKLATVGKKWRGSSTVIGFRRNGEVVIGFESGSIASQKLNSRRVKTLMALPKYGSSYFYSYVESLVLLDKESDEGDTSDASGSTDEKLPKRCS